MLKDADAMATIAVKDVKAARKFYEATLGLKPLGSEQPTVLTLASGNSKIVVYESRFAGTNKATSATWGLGKDFDAVMKALQAKGVAFEHYDLPGLTRKGDVHVAEGFSGAWLKDPDGNILHINNQ